MVQTCVYIMVMLLFTQVTSTDLFVGAILFADSNDHTWTYEHDFAIHKLVEDVYHQRVFFDVRHSTLFASYFQTRYNIVPDTVLETCESLISAGSSLILVLDFTFGDGASKLGQQSSSNKLKLDVQKGILK